jgi:hypothetical protein
MGQKFIVARVSANNTHCISHGTAIEEIRIRIYLLLGWEKGQSQNRVQRLQMVITAVSAAIANFASLAYFASYCTVSLSNICR